MEGKEVKKNIYEMLLLTVVTLCLCLDAATKSQCNECHQSKTYRHSQTICPLSTSEEKILENLNKTPLCGCPVSKCRRPRLAVRGVTMNSDRGAGIRVPQCAR